MIKQDFNKNWLVKAALNPADESKEESVGCLSQQETMVTLPHDAMIFEKRDANNPEGYDCGFYPGKDYKYTKKFYVGEENKGQTFVVEFEGIYNRGYIYVNEVFVGNTRHGYMGKVVDITPYLYYGVENKIEVEVVNSDTPNSRWYTGSGIYRPVYLYKGGNVRVDVDGLRLSTSDVAENIAAVKVDARILYDAKVGKTVNVKIEIFDGDGVIVAEERSRVSLLEQGQTDYVQRVYVKNPKLWSVETPELYQCKMTLWDDENVLDVAESTFGIRKLELNPLDGLKINGRSVLLRGGCIHHDNGPVGAATFGRAEERRIELLKKAGFNSVRIAHNSSSKALLDACDRLGMLVMEESFDTWTHRKRPYDSALVFMDCWEEYFEDIVRKDFNHPSVFMYSVGNEILLGKMESAKLGRRLVNKMRQLDPTRYVTNAINGFVPLQFDGLDPILEELGINLKKKARTDDINETMTAMLESMNEISKHPKAEACLKEDYGMLDLIGLNYMCGAYEGMAAFPNRIFYGSETFPWDIDLNWKKVKEIPSCIGDYVWTAWDYIGEGGIGVATYDGKRRIYKEYPLYLANCGDIDITGYRRPISYFREIVFGLRKKPYIAVQAPEYYGEEAMCTPWAAPISVSSWTWNGFEGKNCLVEVYSDAPEVELFINGKSAGKHPAGEEHRFRTVYDVPYEPGEIKAMGIYEDGVTEKFALQTANDALCLSLEADRQVVAEGELIYVSIELKDSSGIVHTTADRSVKVSVEGAGSLQALASADPWSEENFFDDERMTYYGRALAVVRAGDAAGNIRMSVAAQGMETAFVELQVK